MTTIPTPQELAADLAPIVQGHIDLLAAKLRAGLPSAPPVTGDPWLAPETRAVVEAALGLRAATAARGA